MSSEASFIAALRAIATSDAARGLLDDAAVFDFGGSRLVLTMDAIVECVHFLPDDPPETVAWKLVATNVSDLAAKGAVPKGCLLSYPLAVEGGWDTAFLQGLAEACRAFAIPLLGGDTVRQPPGSARSFALVALGEPVAGVPVPSRATAVAGDRLWLSGPIGDAGMGLALLRAEQVAASEYRDALVAAYRKPTPNCALGVALAPHVSAMMDVSDGLLVDTRRLADASGVAAVIDLDRLPLSRAFVATSGEAVDQRLSAATAGDDYCLLLAAAPAREEALLAAARTGEGLLHPIGRIMGGRGLTVLFNGEAVPLPMHLGYEH